MEQIETTVQNRVARVRLNAPPRNILTAALQDEIRLAFESLRARDDHNAVFLESSVKDFFSAGADVKEHIGVENCRRMLASAHELIAEVLRSPVPTVCLVQGYCFGGAFELALACDQLLASHNATFALPEITLGCFPPAALALFPSKLPPLLLAELVQLGRGTTAENLAARGAGVRVANVDPAKPTFEELQADAAKTFADLPRGPLIEATRLLRSGAAERFLSAVGPVEQAYLERLLTLHDAKEGPEAFLAKRKPDWDHVS